MARQQTQSLLTSGVSTSLAVVALALLVCTPGSSRREGGSWCGHVHGGVLGASVAPLPLPYGLPSPRSVVPSSPTQSQTKTWWRDSEVSPQAKSHSRDFQLRTAPLLSLYFDVTSVVNVTNDDETQGLLFALAGLANSASRTTSSESTRRGGGNVGGDVGGDVDAGGSSAVLLNTGALDLDFPASDATWRAYLEVSYPTAVVVTVFSAGSL